MYLHLVIDTQCKRMYTCSNGLGFKEQDQKKDVFTMYMQLYMDTQCMQNNGL